MEKLEKRMYSLVLYNISPIQQGIQASHSITEYELMYGDTKLYKDWAENWKTMIILNGGTSNKVKIGTMEKHLKTLRYNDVDLQYFHEPDLNDSLTAISFIVDERVFNKDKWQEEEPSPYWGGLDNNPSKKWIEYIGGDKNHFLREFLKDFRLA